MNPGKDALVSNLSLPSPPFTIFGSSQWIFVGPILIVFYSWYDPMISVAGWGICCSMRVVWNGRTGLKRKKDTKQRAKETIYLFCPYLLLKFQSASGLKTRQMSHIYKLWTCNFLFLFFFRVYWPKRHHGINLAALNVFSLYAFKFKDCYCNQLKDIFILYWVT